MFLGSYVDFFWLTASKKEKRQETFLFISKEKLKKHLV
jgi:hypothetical protein